MKKLFPIIAALLVIVGISFASCKKAESSYTCNCTYIPDANDTGKSNITESTTLKEYDLGDAQIDCDKLDTKYGFQYYNGSCVIQ